MKGEIRDFVKECFEEIAHNNDFEIEAMEIAEDHVHIFLAFPQRFSIAAVVQRFKGKPAREIFQRFPEVKRKLCVWRGEFGEDGYFVRTVGDKVTKDIIKKYIEYHKKYEKSPQQLKLF